MNADFEEITPRRRVGLTLGLMGGLMTLYLCIGWMRVGGATPVHTVPTAIDDWVPFSLAWLPIYLFMLPMSWAPVCAFADRRNVHRWIASVLLMYVPAVPLWLAWPVTVPRDPVAVEGFWSFVFMLMRATDPPVNCLPSMHVAVATLAGLLIRQVDKPVGNGLLLLMPFIWYSTMALDQHWFLDGLVGVVIAVAVEWTTRRLMPVPTAAMVALDRRAHWGWIGPFLAVVGGVFVYWLVAV